MILSDGDIRQSIRRGELAIEPFTPRHLTPNGYDLSVAEVMVGGEVSDSAVIPPLTWFAVSTREYLRLPRHAAQLWIRSSYARRGVMASFGKVDIGFEGTLTLSGFTTREEVTLGAGDRFCQVVFEEVCSPPRQPYEGKYKGQRQITLG
ncbi:MAG: dCTP deaminase [Candidatus Thermoplasmatota archaeon]|nr:dCTP deaminase [Candidatus Thermoplasmatota archaeon]MDD5779162.1 dCTP deaminase [Candidatus Thermoplasmatota archaeon]